MTAAFRVLVCGGRDYADEAYVAYELTRLQEVHGPLVVIQGGAAGADAHARRWAEGWEDSAVACITVPADWETHGRAAGPIRNRRMLEEHRPDLVLAFPGGRGTADMVRQARVAGVEVREVRRP